MKGEIILYQTENGQTKIEVILENETVWLNQYQMEELFQTDRTSILRHIKNIYKTGELEEKSTSRYIPRIQIEGTRRVKRNILCYNFDVLVSLGFKVNSQRGVNFRKWISSYFSNLVSTKGDYLSLFNELFEDFENRKEKVYLYLMIENSTGYYKIGVSKTPQNRERTLQSQKPDIFMIFNKEFEKKVAYKYERRLHNFFKSKRIRGEWFELDKADLNNFFLKINSWINE